MLISGIIHDRRVLDVSFTAMPSMSSHAMQDIAVEICLPVLGRSPGPTLHHLGQGQPQRPCHIRHQGSAATIGVPVILLEDSLPQAILKFYGLSSLHYKSLPRIPSLHFYHTKP